VKVVLEHLVEALATLLLLLVAELGRRMHARRRSTSDRPPPDSIPTRPETQRPRPPLFYAQRPSERCKRGHDCVLVKQHDGPCYPTAFLHDPAQRKRLRRLRGAPEGE
jgi:hypothetical protein